MVAVDVDLQPLVREARAGDPGAWDRLFKRYQLPLYTYAYELVRDEQTSQDIVQETFISACRHLGTLRDDARFGSWLFGIAHQKCAQQWRRRGREPLVAGEEVLDDVAGEEADPAELLVRQEQEGEFLRLLDRLPAPQRSVLLLHFIEDFSIDEIATIAGVPPGTVKSRLYHAKRALRRHLEDEP
jgi:RNA polymerase sigma-70 factor, ECF subfamily